MQNNSEYLSHLMASRIIDVDYYEEKIIDHQIAYSGVELKVREGGVISRRDGGFYLRWANAICFIKALVLLL